MSVDKLGLFSVDIDRVFIDEDGDGEDDECSK